MVAPGHKLSSSGAPGVRQDRCRDAIERYPPANRQPLHWHLLTSLEAGDVGAACEIVRLYRLRWRIEEVFRALKSDGMRLEDTQMHQAERLFKLALVGLAAARRTIRLVDARNVSARPAADVIDAALLSVAETIGPTLEGNAERQKTPHPPHSLAWLAWIIARLGGWNCYYKSLTRIRDRNIGNPLILLVEVQPVLGGTTYATALKMGDPSSLRKHSGSVSKPPGPKTLRAGWGQYETMAAGFAVAMTFKLKSNPASTANAGTAAP